MEREEEGYFPKPFSARWYSGEKQEKRESWRGMAVIWCLTATKRKGIWKGRDERAEDRRQLERGERERECAISKKDGSLLSVERYYY